MWCRICRAVAEPRLIGLYILRRIVRFIPAKLYLKLKGRLCLGYWPNFSNPQTYNEKLQWLKLYDYHEEYTMMVDKIISKDYVASIIGDKYVIPTLGIYNSIEDIDWEKLPNKFVVKSANDSGGVIVCKDKSKLNLEESKEKLRKLGGRDYTIYTKEYPYKNVQHRFIAEQYMVDESGFELKDYKIFCFDGEPRFLFIATGRQQNDTRFDFYDIEFNHLDVLNGHENADEPHQKPQNFREMLEIARRLSKGIPHVRVDLYNINGNIYFGELAFFHNSGMVPFKPLEWDYKFGEYLNLPMKNNHNASVTMHR